ncbi:armadillo-type protein [Pyronema domesticum]|nr:armadillo-type protein [Pyronema domesticum]
MGAIKRKQEKPAVRDAKKTKVEKPSRKVKKAPSPSPEPEPSSESEDELDDEEVEEDEVEDVEEDKIALSSDEAEEKDAEGDSSMKTPAEKTPEELAKAKASRAEQKRLIAERKQAKPMGDVIHKSKKLWEQMRRRDMSAEERKKKIDEHQEMIRGHIKDLVFKHDASRVVQTALKYGSKAVREEVAKELKGTYLQLAQSSYGKYLVAKVMHYGSAEIRKMVVNEFCGHVKKLIRHREASFVIEDCYAQFGTTEQKARMVREFYGAEFALFGGKDGETDASLKKILEKSPEKRAVIMKNMLELLTAVVEKGAIIFSLVHKAMLEYVSNVTPGTTDATEFIELVKEHIAPIGFTKDGAQVVMRCLALGNAKDRKVMLKALKGEVPGLASNENGHQVLLTLMDVVDDTVLVNKSIFAELQDPLYDLAVHKFGRIPLLYPFVGRKQRLVAPSTIKAIEEMDEIRAATSKKDADVRQAELRTHLSPIVLKGVADNAAELVKESFGCQFITEVLLGASGDKTAAVEAVAAIAAGNPEDKDHVAATAAGGRMLKTLVAGGHYNNKTKQVDAIDPPLNFATPLYNTIKPQLSAWATGAGSFVVVSLLETSSFPEVKDLKKELAKCKKEIEKAAKDGNKGAAVVGQKL